jgi:hypothetical protein
MKTDWMKFTKGDIVNKGFKIERIQLRITDSYFINNFVDVIKDHLDVLNEVNKIMLKGDGAPIAIYPRDDDGNFSNTTTFLDSIKDTDINTIYISMAENNNGFMDTKLLDDTVVAIKGMSKIEIRYFLRD